MTDSLFLGLPPPSATPVVVEQPSSTSIDKDSFLAPTTAAAPVPALKSSLKRNKPLESQSEAPQKRLRFKTTTDATETQVIEAMQKIASHIKNPSKFSKASKLALQLIQAGSVTPGTSNHFFDLLESAMSSSAACVDSSLRVDYQSLFSASENVTEYFSKQQKNQLTTWTLKAVVANDLYTDDSFVFSKAAGKIKEAISSLPSTTGDDDTAEAVSLAKAGKEVVESDGGDSKNTSTTISPQLYEEAADPFGLEALLPSSSKKDEKSQEKKDIAASIRKAEDEEESKRFYKSQREALIVCLEIAARRYKIPWAQTVIDILVKHAYDNIDRFTSRQREAIEKLWASIHEQLIRRKQGKSVTGKLDMNAFEWLQEKYSHEKISIRHAVGGSGERRAQQWLG